MKVIIVQSIAGLAQPEHDLPEFGFGPGDIVDLKESLAKAWIEAGIAAKPKRGAAPVQAELTPETEA